MFVVFDFADQELPVYFALMATYLIAAYVILPYAVRMGLKFAQRRHVPSFTTAADGLLADPVNLVLVGTLDQLRAAFAAIGWVEADKLTLASSWRMAKAFVLNRPYPAAPFSTLYLFGRGQDIGFQIFAYRTRSEGPVPPSRRLSRLPRKREDYFRYRPGTDVPEVDYSHRPPLKLRGGARPAEKQS